MLRVTGRYHSAARTRSRIGVIGARFRAILHTARRLPACLYLCRSSLVECCALRVAEVHTQVTATRAGAKLGDPIKVPAERGRPWGVRIGGVCARECVPPRASARAGGRRGCSPCAHGLLHRSGRGTDGGRSHRAVSRAHGRSSRWRIQSITACISSCGRGAAHTACAGFPLALCRRDSHLGTVYH